MTEFELHLYNRYIKATKQDYIVPFELNSQLYRYSYEVIKEGTSNLKYEYPSEFAKNFAFIHGLKKYNYMFDIIENVLNKRDEKKFYPEFIEYTEISDDDLEMIKYMSEEYNKDNYKDFFTMKEED